MSDYAVYEGKLVPVDELMHHGIKGMKWGVRRYQNPDGTLTAEGRKRYGYGTLDEEGKAAYKSYKKGDAKLIAQATGKAAVRGALLGGAVGLATGGPVGGLIGMVGSMAASSLSTAAINSGKSYIDNKEYKKALIKQADERRDKENAKEKETTSDKKEHTDNQSNSVVTSYTNDARKAIERSDYKSAGRAISEIPYDYYVEETNKLESQGKTFDEASRIANSGKSEHGISPSEKVAFDAAEKLLSEIKDKKAKEEFLSELSVGMDASQRDNPSIMVYNNNSGKITSYYDTNTVHKELKKNGLNGFDENGKVNTDDLDTIYKVKQKGTNDYYLWGEKLESEKKQNFQK